MSLLVRCPDFRGCDVHKQGVWDSQMCLSTQVCLSTVLGQSSVFIKVSSFQGVLIKIIYIK